MPDAELRGPLDDPVGLCATSTSRAAETAATAASASAQRTARLTGRKFEACTIVSGRAPEGDTAAGDRRTASEGGGSSTQLGMTRTRSFGSPKVACITVAR